ncbi:PREDICTED: ETS-like protein pointed [Habropoda laboriosa]|uniref:ETS-like protein pointed n=1 Tax=Habropoda laboriosa TaxID=597456 RepID=UPI00083D85B5|nr:PREDICTED: ETS-like protein pointed [Habropoda laboriosa]
MAGKPEQPSTHPAPPNHGHHHHNHHHHHHHHHHQHHQQQQHQQHHNQQQQPQEQQHPQHAQGIQQNSVLVYVSGENFAYATAVGQNAAAAAAAATAVGYQSPQQATYAGILPPQVATAAATFPAKTAIYCNDNNGSAVGGSANNCCRLKPLEYVSTDGDSSRSARSISTGNTEDEEDYGTIVSNNSLLYRQTNLVQATSAVTATTTMTCVVSACDSKHPANRSPLENDSNNTENLATNNVEPICRVNAGEMVPNKLFPSRIHGEIYPAGVRLADGYNNNGSRIVQGNPGEGCVSLLSGDDACVAYVRQGNEPSQASASVFQGDSVEQRVNMDEKSRQQDGFDNQTGSSSLSSSGSSVGVVSGGGSVVVVGSGGSGAASCDSVRSDTGESSTYSSLSSPESQSQSAHDGLSTATVNSGGSCAQQAARQPPLTRINNSNNNNAAQQNVVLTMNGSAVVTQQQQQQQAITVPRGWKRICTNGVIIYIRIPGKLKVDITETCLETTHLVKRIELL